MLLEKPDYLPHTREGAVLFQHVTDDICNIRSLVDGVFPILSAYSTYQASSTAQIKPFIVVQAIIKVHMRQP
jgi:hypothetical protein